MHGIRPLLLVSTIAAATAAATASAAPKKYTWHGQGTDVFGSTHCAGYTLDISANVENRRISGQWQQAGRVVRNFDFPIAADGTFGGEVDLQTGLMTVKGEVTKDGAVRFDMKGYCIFGGWMKKVQ